MTSIPDLNSQRCIDTDNFPLLRFRTSNLPGFQFGNSTTAGLNLASLASAFGVNQDILSSSLNSTYSEAEYDKREYSPDSCLEEINLLLWASEGKFLPKSTSSSRRFQLRTRAVAPSEVGQGSAPSPNPITWGESVQLIGVPWSTRAGTRLSKRLLNPHDSPPCRHVRISHQALPVRRLDFRRGVSFASASHHTIGHYARYCSSRAASVLARSIFFCFPLAHHYAGETQFSRSGSCAWQLTLCR